MFLLFGRKTKYRPLAESHVVQRRCPECGQDARIFACERVHTYEAWFVGLFDTNQQVWVCSGCKEEVDLPDALPGARDEAERERRQLADAAETRAARKQQLADKAQAMKQKVDDELAALKAKLGRPK